MSSQAKSVNPTIQAFQKRIDALADFKPSLNALAQNTAIGEYSYRVGMGEVKPGTLGGIVSVVSETAPKANATMPPKWKAPTGGSSFFLLTLDGSDIPVLISALDQDELEGRIGNCLTMTFGTPPNSKSNSTLGYTISVNGIDHYSVGCGHYVRPQDAVSNGSNHRGAKPAKEGLVGVTTCGANCARCRLAMCHSGNAETPGPAAARNGQWVGNGLCSAEPKETINLGGVQVLINRTPSYNPVSSPDLCIFQLASLASATQLDFGTCKTGWINFVQHIMTLAKAPDDAGLPPVLAVLENLDGIGEPITIVDLQNAKQNNEDIYACTRGSHATFMVGFVDTKHEVIEPGKVAIGSLLTNKKLCQPGDCGAPWFALIKDPTKPGKYQLRLLGHHHASHRPPLSQAVLVPWEATVAELPHILPAPATGAPPMDIRIISPIRVADPAPAVPAPASVPAPTPPTTTTNTTSTTTAASSSTSPPAPQDDSKPDAKRKNEQAGADDSKRHKS